MAIIALIIDFLLTGLMFYLVLNTIRRDMRAEAEAKEVARIQAEIRTLQGLDETSMAEVDGVFIAENDDV